MNKIVKVLKRGPIIGFRDDKIYQTPVYGPYSQVVMKYSTLCTDLGFLPDENFIKVTRSGRITFSPGSSESYHKIRALRRACENQGYVPTKGVYDSLCCL